jgi:hypothetical protein
LVPAERNQFRHAQAVAISQLDHGGIPVPRPPEAFGHAYESLDFCGRQIFTASPMRIACVVVGHGVKACRDWTPEHGQRWTHVVAERLADGWS